MSRFSDAADLWLSKVDEMVQDGRRSPGTVDTYRHQLRNHVLPAMGEVRLGEATTPPVDKVVTRSGSASNPPPAHRQHTASTPPAHLKLPD